MVAKKKFKYDYKIIPELCYSCGTCSNECPSDSIFIDDIPQYAIDQSSCIHCGRCYRSCPVNAIEKIPRN